jgi:hypothetical protein
MVNPMPAPSDEDAKKQAARPGLWRQIGADLRRGRSIELYITVAVAITIAALGVAGAVNSGVIGAATLAVLALLATSGLASRHQSDEMNTKLDRIEEADAGQVAAQRFFLARYPAMDAEVATASQIGLVGVSLTRTVRDLLPTLDRRLKVGASVRVMLIDIDSSAQHEVVFRSKEAHAPDFYRHRVSATIDLLRVLASSAKTEGALELRVLPFVPTFGMCLIDAPQEHGRMYVEVYQHRTLEANPSFALRADRDGRWYRLFADQFETLWESGRPVSLRG